MNKLRVVLQSRYFILVLFIFILLLAFIRCNIPTKSLYSIEEKNFQGVIVSKKIDGDKFSFIIKGKERIKCTYYLKNIEEKEYYSKIKFGVRFKLNGNLELPSKNTIPNTFNYQKYLKYNHINYVMNVKNIDKIDDNTSFINKIRNSLYDRIMNYKSKNYMLTLIMGDKSLLEDDIKERYQDLGVSHIFAISGLHISIISLILMFFLKRINENLGYIITIIFLLLYLFIVSFQPSVCRSVVLFSFLYLNKRLCLDLSIFKVFILTVSFILLIEPFFLFNTGFLYSCVISGFLIKYGSMVKGNYINKCLLVSIFSFLVSLPIIINSNFEVNILSVFNNLFYVPLISFVVYPLSLICLIIKPFDDLLFLIVDNLELISNYFLSFSIVIPKLSTLEIFLYYVLLIIFFESFNFKYLLIMFLLIIFNKYSCFFDRSFYVYSIDVGQGDATLVKKKNKTVLIDTGGKMNYVKESWKIKKEYHISDNYISFFKSIGIDKLNYLVITHGDYDHMGETINLVNNFKVEKVIFNCGPYNDLEQELIKVLDKKKIQYFSCIKELNVDKNKLYFLQTKEYDNENDNSNVIYTELNGYKFMFMGDASTSTENEIMNKYNLPDIDVLKVGHHGSNTSSGKAFINEINSKYSIISVGKNNRYGHPNKEVIDNLKNSKIYRTDKQGSIMFKIKNNKLKIETCSS